MMTQYDEDYPDRYRVEYVTIMCLFDALLEELNND